MWQILFVVSLNMVDMFLVVSDSRASPYRDEATYFYHTACGRTPNLLPQQSSDRLQPRGCSWFAWHAWFEVNQLNLFKVILTYSRQVKTWLLYLFTVNCKVSLGDDSSDCVKTVAVHRWGEYGDVSTPTFFESVLKCSTSWS